VKILIIEDDQKLAKLLAKGLRQAGHVVDLEHDGADGLYAALDGPYDALILDLMLPSKDGISVASELRAKNVATPVLMLTARDTVEGAVAGLDAGADDYLRKPFAFEELEARLRTLTRRAANPPHMVFSVSDLVFDKTSKSVERRGRRIELTSRELAFLEYLMKNAGIVVTRRMLETALWDRRSEISSNVVEVYIGRLRAKIEFDDLPPLITTIHGIGYRLGPTARS
jgi:two-component system, OmpR family, response regulator